ncbi:MAG: hypothetical protein KI792_03235 [Alphaproteobacteria bacterium]|nr:hypothetical protein [Alphaproteobacteria bacterium SS10]
MRMRTNPGTPPELPEERGAWAEIRRNWLLIVILLLGAGGAFFLLQPEEIAMPEVSVASTWQAPDREGPLRNISFLTQNGNQARISDFYGRPKVVVGYKLECEECMLSLKSLDVVAGEFAGRVDFIPLAFSTRPGPLTELIQKTYKEYGITNLRAYTLSEQEAFGVFNPLTLPHSYITTANNQVVRIHTGEGLWNEQRIFDALTTLSGGEAQQ